MKGRPPDKPYLYASIPSDAKSDDKDALAPIEVKEGIQLSASFAEAMNAVISVLLSSKVIRVVSFVDSIFYAGYDASGVLWGLEDMEDMSDDTLAKHLGVSIEHLKIVVPFIFAVYSFTLNYPSLVAGLNTSIRDFIAWKNREPLEFLPDSHCEKTSCCLSQTTKINLTLALIIFIGGFAAASDGISGDYFVANTKKDIAFLSGISDFSWKIFSIYCSYVVAKMTFFTETPEVKKFFFRSIIESIEEPSELTPFFKKLARYLGDLLRVIGGVEVAIETYVAWVALMHAQSSGFLYLLFAISFVRSTSDLFFTGQKGLDAIDALFVKLKTGIPNVKELIVFFLTISPILLVVDAQRELFRAFLIEPDSELPFDCPPTLIEIIADGTAVREGVVQAYTLYPLVLWLADATIALARKACCYSDRKAYLIDDDDDDEYDEKSEQRVELISSAERGELLNSIDDEKSQNENSDDEKNEYQPPTLNTLPVYSNNINSLFAVVPHPPPKIQQAPVQPVESPSRCVIC